MIRITAFVALAGCALYSGTEPPADEVDVTSSVHTFDLPQDPIPDVDVLFVIDASPTMTDVQARVLASVPAIADAIEQNGFGLLHVGAITSDVNDRGVLVGGRFVSLQRNPDHTTWHDFDGALVDALMPMIDVGTQGGANQPLDALDLALAPDANPGFRRGTAELLVIPITNRDDDSIGAVGETLTTIPSASIAVSGVYVRPAPRLDAFLARFGDRSRFTSITDGDLATAAGALQVFFGSTLPLYCIDEPVIEPFDCAMSDVVDGVEQRVLRECDPAASNTPCWMLHADRLCTLAPTSLRLEFRRSLWPLRNTHVIGQCATRP